MTGIWRARVKQAGGEWSEWSLFTDSAHAPEPSDVMEVQNIRWPKSGERPPSATLDETFTVVDPPPSRPAQPLLPGERLIRSEAFHSAGATVQIDYTNMRTMQTTTLITDDGRTLTMMISRTPEEVRPQDAKRPDPA